MWILICKAIYTMFERWHSLEIEDFIFRVDSLIEG